MNGIGMQICKKRCPQFLCLPLHRNGGKLEENAVLRAVINGRLFSTGRLLRLFYKERDRKSE